MSGLFNFKNDALRNSVLLALLGLGATFAPPAHAQNQAGAATSGSAAAPTQSAPAAKPPASNATQPAAATAAQTEPQMQDQSAPAAESLGEAARRARAQKTQASKPKVFNDDSVSTLSGHGVSVVGGGNSGSGSPSGANSYAGAPASAAGNNQEAYWRGRANEIRRQMAACDQKISEIQDEIAKHGAVSVDPMSGAQAGVIFVEDRNAQIQQVQKQKDGYERQLEELAEEGRKAGADSGWFR